MKKFSIAFICITSFFIFSSTLTTTSRIIYSATAKLPASISNVESLPAYYKGYKIDLRERAELPECGESRAFSIIVTPKVDFSAKNNTVRYLKLAKDQPFLWYDLTVSFNIEKHDAEDKRVYSWNIEKRKENDVPERLPEHALVVLMKPELIETVKAEQSIPGAVDIPLPTIVFKENIDAEEFKDVINEIIIGPALDLDAIHSKNKPACMANQGSAVITTIAHHVL